MTHMAMTQYVEADAIRERLSVLQDKCARFKAYNASCAAGEPDESLLDEKQRAILAFRNELRAQRGWPPLTRFPWQYRKTLGRTMLVLQTRLCEMKRVAA